MIRTGSFESDGGTSQASSPLSESPSPSPLKPTIAMQLCVNNVALPIHPVDDTLMVPITLHGRRDHRWLHRVFGKLSWESLPGRNIVSEIKDAVAALRGKRTKVTRLIDSKGVPLPSVVSVTVRGFTLDTTTGTTLYLPATVDAITWFMAELWSDLHANAEKVSVVAAELSDSDENCDEVVPPHDADVCDIDDAATAALEHDALLMSELDRLTTRAEGDPIKWAKSKHAFFVRRKTDDGSTVDKFFTVRNPKRCSTSGRVAEAIWQLDRAEEFARTGLIKDDRAVTDEAGNILMSVKRRRRQRAEVNDDLADEP